MVVTYSPIWLCYTNPVFVCYYSCIQQYCLTPVVSAILPFQSPFAEVSHSLLIIIVNFLTMHCQYNNVPSLRIVILSVSDSLFFSPVVACPDTKIDLIATFCKSFLII